MFKNKVVNLISSVGGYMGFVEIGVEIILDNNKNTFIYHDTQNKVLYYDLNEVEILEILLQYFDSNEIEIMSKELNGEDLYNALNEWFKYKHDIDKYIGIYKKIYGILK